MCTRNTTKANARTLQQHTIIYIYIVCTVRGFCTCKAWLRIGLGEQKCRHLFFFFFLLCSILHHKYVFCMVKCIIQKVKINISHITIQGFFWLYRLYTYVQTNNNELNCLIKFFYFKQTGLFFFFLSPSNVFFFKHIHTYRT